MERRKKPKHGTLSESEQDALNIKNLIQLQEILAQQIAVFKRIADGDYDDELKELARNTLDLTEKEYWDLDIKIDKARWQRKKAR